MIHALSNTFILSSEIDDLFNGIFDFSLHAFKTIKIIVAEIINDEVKP